MGTRVEWVGYGRPAAVALRDVIAAAKGDEPLAPVTVIVPSNHVGVAARRLLASGAIGPVCGRGLGLVAVMFSTVYRLADLLGSPRLAGSGRRPVSTPLLAAATRAALAEDPGVFGPVARHPATETALVGAYRELRDLSERSLGAVAASSARAADVVRLYRRARDRLKHDWYDEEDLMEAAAAALRAGDGGPLGATVVYLPQRLSRHGAGLLAAAGARPGPDLTVVAGTTGDARADADVRRAVGRLGAEPASPPDVDAGRLGGEVVSAERTRFVTASDADDEVRAAVRAVVAEVRAGTPLDRIAILHASPEPYARLAHEHLRAAHIPANGASVLPLAARVAGRSLLGLLTMADGGFRRQDVFAWLAGAPVLSVPVTAWERLSRKAAVVAGRSDWDERLARLADQLDAEAELADADPDEPDWRAERARTSADQARSLRTFALGLIDDLADAAAGPRRWAHHTTWARALLARYLGGARRTAAWPVAEVKAAERVDLALDRLAALDAVEGPVGLDVFTRSLQIEMEDDLGRVGRFGEGVLVGSVAMGVGLDLDLVVILGLAEGTFPGPVREDSLLPDHERDAAAGDLPLRRQRVDGQHRELLAALAGARRHVLCVPRGDLRRSIGRVPSRWALDAASSIAGRRWWSRDLLEADSGWVTHVASFDAGLRRLTFPATGQEHRLRALMAGPEEGPGDMIHVRGSEVVGARRGDRFTRFDGNLAGLPLRSPAGSVTSATRLERWVVCPFAYLLQDVLGVEPVENPEEQLEITPLVRGELVHSVLEQFIKLVLAEPAPPAPGDAWTPEDRSVMRAVGEELCDAYEASGLTGRAVFWQRDRARILRDLQRFLDIDEVHRASQGARPVAAELAFGLPGAAVGAVPLTLPDGRTVRFRGKADRVDEAEDGTLYVIDYKTGKRDGYSNLSEADPDLGGRKLQLPVYGTAARTNRGRPDAPVEARYWFVSAKGDFRQIGYSVTDDVLVRVGRTLGAIVEGIEAGMFPSHPIDGSTSRVSCQFCDPDGLGVIDLRRRWDRKRHDPAFAPYADLAEPLDEPEPDGAVISFA